MNAEKCGCVLKVMGRGLYGLPLAAFGVTHFMNSADLVGYVPTYLPMPMAVVYLTGVILLLGGLSITFNKWVKWPALLLGLTLLGFALMIHYPVMAEAGPTNLLKDLALAGTAFYFSAKACLMSCKVKSSRHEEGGCC